MIFFHSVFYFLLVMDSEYLFLPSNASDDLYPDNKISDFRVRLSERVKLPNLDYEVGLMQISYTNCINIFTDDVSNIFTIEKDDGTLKEVHMNNTPYENVENFITSINNLIYIKLKNAEKCKFTFHPHVQKVSFDLLEGSGVKSVTLSRHIADILGFRNTELTTTTHAHLLPDLYCGMRNIYVYCDLIRNSHVGNIRSCLLRQIPIQSGKPGEIVLQTFQVPFFLEYKRAVLKQSESHFATMLESELLFH